MASITSCGSCRWTKCPDCPATLNSPGARTNARSRCKRSLYSASAYFFASNGRPARTRDVLLQPHRSQPDITDGHLRVTLTEGLSCERVYRLVRRDVCRVRVEWKTEATLSGPNRGKCIRRASCSYEVRPAALDVFSPGRVYRDRRHQSGFYRRWRQSSCAVCRHRVAHIGSGDREESEQAQYAGSVIPTSEGIVRTFQMQQRAAHWMHGNEPPLDVSCRLQRPPV